MARDPNLDEVIRALGGRANDPPVTVTEEDIKSHRNRLKIGKMNIWHSICESGSEHIKTNLGWFIKCVMGAFVVFILVMGVAIFPDMKAMANEYLHTKLRELETPGERPAEPAKVIPAPIPPAAAPLPHLEPPAPFSMSPVTVPPRVDFQPPAAPPPVTGQ